MTHQRLIDDKAPLAPIERQTLASVVIDRIAAFVRDQQLGPGDALPSQHALAERLGVSRPVLREALQGLASMGMVDIRPGSGVYVTDPTVGGDPNGLAEIATHEAALEMLEARMVVEVELAGLAALRADEADLQRMDKLLAKLKRAISRGQLTADITSDFHRTLARSGHNATLYRMAQMLAKPRKAQGFRIEHALPDVTAGEFETHLTLRNAVVSGDPERARREMRKHLEIAHGMEDRVAQLRSQVDSDNRSGSGRGR